MSEFLGGLFGILVLLAIAAVAGYAGGRAKGKRASAQDAEARYRAGYLAGHFAGWRDAGGYVQGRPSVNSAALAPPKAVPFQPSVRGPVVPAGAARTSPASAAPGPAAAQQAVHRQPARQEPAQQRPLPPTAEERAAAAARKEKRDRQNINVTLYVASLLLVASSALFIGTSLPASLRFAGVWGITVLFYAGGFVLEKLVPRLRPAAVAFTGTGLALIPVTGLAMYNFVLHHGPSAWLVTSIAGTVAYVFAAVRLDSRVLAYLSLTFMVSTAWSGISMLGGALVWYFVAMIGLAVVLTVSTLTGLRGVPSVYLRPLQTLHPSVVPLVALVVTFIPHYLAEGEYALIMGLCGVYFAVLSALRSTRFRLQHFHGARACLSLAAAVAVSDAGAALPVVLFVASMVLGAQAVAVAFLGSRLSVWFPSATAEGAPAKARERSRIWRGDALVTFGLQTAVALVAATLLLVSRPVPLELPFFAALACALILAWKLSGAAELLPLVVLLLAAPFMASLGGIPTAVLLAAPAAIWLLRAVLPGAGAVLRGRFVLAARVAATLATPAFVAGILPESTDRPALVLLSFIAACQAQLLAEAVAAGKGTPMLAPDAVLAGFAGVGLAALPALYVMDHSVGHLLGSIALYGVLAAAAAAGFLVLPTGAQAGTVPGGREILSPAVMLLACGFAFAVFPLAVGNISLLAILAYLLLQCLRVAGSPRRKLYLWGARAAFTVLIPAGYLQYLDGGNLLQLGGEAVHPATVVFLACGLQLLPALAKAKGDSFTGAVEAAVVLPIMAGACVVLAFSVRNGWQPGAAAVGLALGAAAAGFCLRRASASAVFAPVAFVLLLVLRGGWIHELEVLLTIFAAFSAAMVPASPQRIAKGIHFAAARVLTAALAGVLAHDLSASVTVVSLTFAAVFLLQHVLRYGMRKRLTDFPFQQGAVWITLAAQAALPLSYVLQTPDDGGRWVLLLELFLLGCSSLGAWRLFAARGAQYLAAPAALAAVLAAGAGTPGQGMEWLGEPLITEEGMLLASFALALIPMGARIFRTPGPLPLERWFWLFAAALPATAAFWLSFGLEQTAVGASVLLAALLLFQVSHLERIPAAYLGAVPLTLAGATVLAAGQLDAAWPEFPSTPWWDFLPWLLGCVPAAMLLYGLRFQAVRHDLWRRVTLVAGTVAGLGTAAAVGLVEDATAVAGACLVAGAVAVVVVEVPRRYAWNSGEAGVVLVLAAVQRAVFFVEGAAPGFFWPAQWYVVLGAVMATLCYIRGGQARGRVRLMATAALLTLSAAATAFSGTVPQQLWILAGFALLLLAGLLSGERMFAWWGAAGVALSVLWALRSYAFALLALMALVLIAFAVWRLNRTKEADPAGGRVPPAP